jgi:toxin ParE1/3/4
MKVVWTRKAKTQIKDIFDFYSKKVSTALANRIIAGIAQKPSILLKHPELGQKESLLEDINPDLRYIVEGNYKLIYFKNEKHIVIVSVFDTRQNPSKIRSI